jgi:hypothetical protein
MPLKRKIVKTVETVGGEQQKGGGPRSRAAPFRSAAM